MDSQRDESKDIPTCYTERKKTEREVGKVLELKNIEHQQCIHH